MRTNKPPATDNDTERDIDMDTMETMDTSISPFDDAPYYDDTADITAITGYDYAHRP